MANSFRPTADQRNTMVRKSLSFFVAGDVATGTVLRFPMPEAGNIVDVKLSAGTAPTTSSAIYDVHVGGTTIYTTQGNRPTIAATENESTQAGAPEVGNVVEDSVVEVICDQADSGNTGADVCVVVTYIARAAHKV